jgi:hypothetical protein
MLPQVQGDLSAPTQKGTPATATALRVAIHDTLSSIGSSVFELIPVYNYCANIYNDQNSLRSFRQGVNSHVWQLHLVLWRLRRCTKKQQQFGNTLLSVTSYNTSAHIWHFSGAWVYLSCFLPSGEMRFSWLISMQSWLRPWHMTIYLSEYVRAGQLVWM